MDMETDKEGYLELFVKWYEDPEVLQMVKKRVARATLTTHIGNKNNSVIGNVNKGVGDMPKQKLMWYENPEIMELKWYENKKIVQNLKEMFGPSLYEDGIPDLTSFLSRCPRGFEIDLQIVRWSRDPDITKMLHNRWFEPLLNEDGKPQGIAFSRHFPTCYGTYLQADWPTVESALEEHGILCRLDLVFHYITIKTTRTTDPDIIVKAKQLVDLLSIGIPVNEAIRVVKLSDMHCDIIQLGEISGLGSKFGITEVQYSVRLGRLMHYLHILEGLVDLKIFLRATVTGYSVYDYEKEIIAVIGSPPRLQVIRRIVVDVIVHDVDPSPRVNAILTSSQAIMDLKDLHL